MKQFILYALCAGVIVPVKAQPDRPLTRVNETSNQTLGAAPGGRNAFFLPGDIVVPYLLDGMGVSTRIALQNLDTGTVSVNVRFFKADGSDFAVPMAGADSQSSLNLNIPVGGTRIIETTGVAGVITAGWAYLNYPYDAKLSATTFVRYGGAAQPIDIPVPAANLLPLRSVVLFDNRNGFTTRVYAVNTLTSDLTITATWKGMNGETLGTANFSLRAMNSGFISVTDAFPDSAGQTGSVDVSCPGVGLAVHGRRIGPDGFYTFFPAMSSIDWLPQ
jgi:hypothetical protein